MSWNTQGGGGGPLGGGGGPWGNRPAGGGGQPPNLEDIIRRSQDRMRRLLPGGLGAGRGIAVAVVALLAIWLASGLYRVLPDEQGVELIFGAWNGTTTAPGLHWIPPAPLGEAITPTVERVRRTDIGSRSASDIARRGGQPRRAVPRESLVLTGDQNIADIDYAVLWRINNAGLFLFSLQDPERTVRIAAESAMREVVGQTPLETVITGGRTQVQQRTLDLLQRILDSYSAGITVIGVQIQQADPPQQVIDAFNEVQRARQDKERLQNEAQAYENRIVPTSRGEAQSILQQAEGYRERLTKEAEGEASRFTQVYEAYRLAPDVTRRRMYLEAMRDVMSGTNKIIIDSAAGGSGVVPYLPLHELRRAGPPTVQPPRQQPAQHQPQVPAAPAGGTR
ncbi:MAG: FtsH protease activity modulator HflK [Alphaproteobacteria bacterium]|nr:FtsH protease activity modulator HflK [Alphaproteobacteria bacterium]